MSEQLNLDFTNLASFDISASSGSKKDPNILQCKPENGKNNTYEMYIRFIPYIWDMNKSMYSKNIIKISNPAIQKDLVYFDCTGRGSFFWALDEVLKKRESDKIDFAITKDIRSFFKRWYQIFSIVYVNTDQYNVENQHKLKIFTYGSKISKSIELEKAGTASKPKVQVFDFLGGKDYYYLATKQNQAFANYDNSKFVDTPTPFRFMLESGQLHEVTAAELNAIKEGQITPLKQFLMTMPKLDDYFYKQPSNDTLLKSASLLKMILSKYPHILNEAFDLCTDVEFKNMMMASQPLNHNTIPSQPSMNMNETVGYVQQGQQTSYNQPMQSPSQGNQLHPDQQTSYVPQGQQTYAPPVQQPQQTSYVPPVPPVPQGQQPQQTSYVPPVPPVQQTYDPQGQHPQQNVGGGQTDVNEIDYFSVALANL